MKTESTTASHERGQTPNAEPADSSIKATAPGHYRVIRRNGKVTGFDPNKIAVAMTKAFLAVEGGSAAASKRIHQTVDTLTAQVVEACTRRLETGGTVHIEDLQDQVELSLMREGHHKVARAYVLYREERSRERAAQAAARKEASEPLIQVTRADGSSTSLDKARLIRIAEEACKDLPETQPQAILNETLRNLFDGVAERDVERALVMSARTFIEKEPNYSQAAARLLLDSLRREALSFIHGAETHATQQEMSERYPEYFADYIKRGTELQLIDSRLAQYDLTSLGQALRPERDFQFTYLGLQTLYDRYFIHAQGARFELPQAFFMRVAMGLAINEIEREERAIEFYDLLSSFDFMSSTPTLFNSGSLRPQLSSCYLTTVPDDLDGIYGAIKDNALLSKYAGGLGNDWTRVRGMGAHIKGTNGKSQGVVPFLKVVNDTAVAVNQCFAPETQVHTADGVKPIKAVKVGDLVLNQSGEYREVADKFAYNQTEAMVELSIKHSVEPLRVTADHPFWALREVPVKQARHRTLAWLTRGRIQPRWVESSQLSKGDYVAQVVPKEVVPIVGFTEDDARLYGILLGAGHLCKQGGEWEVSGHPERSKCLQFVRCYLETRGIRYWETNQGVNHIQIRWVSDCGVVRDATTGRSVDAGASPLPLTRDDLYDGAGNKRFHRRLSHLPRNQALALVQGLLETAGRVNRGKAKIYFTSTSSALAEGLRYQLLRLGVPTEGQYRENRNRQRSDGGGKLCFGSTTCRTMEITIPAVPEIAERLGCRALSKRNWIKYGNWLFTRVRSVRDIAPVPFVYDLKVEGNPSYMTTAALAHNGGKRKGAVCAYLEAWHVDIEEFLELRKNTGDDRRRTHDMNTASWVPDLFMKRVAEDHEWTLFSPDETPDLHDLTGEAFEAAYLRYEEKALQGEVKNFKKRRAVDLWRKMLSMLFETGHPWIAFKDPCNLRSPQQHVGVVHSSNLCTEITLNTSDEEVAVCNLGSINLPRHTDEKGLDLPKLEKTIATALRMLDNVIDYNYYSVPAARRSNLRHRPVGLGLMGFQDSLYKLRIPYASEEAVAFADRSMEAISYYAIKASSDLAAERGSYRTFEGSLWSRGILPIDSIDLLKQSRGGYLEQDQSQSLDWDSLRKQVKAVGMRNSNCMAIAPTATISNICGVSQSIEPTYQNLFVKSNLSGEFTVVNPYLVQDLKARRLWDEVMVNDLKYFDGSVQPIDRVPEDLKTLYATVFEIDPRWLVEAASRRQKWIDQAQSLNLYMAEPSGKKLDNLYKLAWIRGLKTTYYLRSLGATHVEKSTMTSDQANRLNAVQSSRAPAPEPEVPQACSILDPDCEACQ